MSKQSEAKAAQNYRRTPDTCGNCANYSSETVKHKASFSWSNDYTTEKNMRCLVGGFKVHKTATCDLHLIKEA